MLSLFESRVRAAVAAVVLLTALPLSAATLTVTSMNTLHYGQGATNPSKWAGDAKVKAIWSVMALGGVGMIQEVMPKADLSKFVGNALCKTGVCQTFFPGFLLPVFYGHGTYRETYVFFVTDIATLKPDDVVECKTVSTKCGFSRPPASLLLKPASSNGIWVANFHAIWGKSAPQRSVEAGLMANLLAGLAAKQANSVVIVGGDWNLTAAQVGTALGCSNCAEPTGQTTLNKNGTALSSSYDHFIWNTKTSISNAQVVKVSGITSPVYRKTISDHLPVSAQFSY